MQLPGLTAMLLSSAFLNTPKPAASTEVELEVVEGSGRAATSFSFVVPVEGSVEAWIDRDGSPQRCEIEAHVRNDGLHLQLRCDGPPRHSLRVEATRQLPAGKRTRLAEVRRPGRADHQVFVTLR